MADEILLETQELRREFGALVAVDNVSIQVKAQTLHSIIGPNGAGKTTFFNMLSGNIKPTSGKVRFKGRDITNLPIHKTAHLGIGQIFPNNQPLPQSNRDGEHSPGRPGFGARQF